MALTPERLAELKKQLEPEEHYRVGPARCKCGFDAYKLNGIMIDYAEEFSAHLRWATRQPTYKGLSREDALELIAEVESQDKPFLSATDLEDDRQAQLESIVEGQRADTRIVQSEIEWDRVAIAMRQPMLRDKIAFLIDSTAFLGTPEVIYRRKPHESVKEAANRLQIEVLEEADQVIALLFSLGLIPKGYR